VNKQVKYQVHNSNQKPSRWKLDLLLPYYTNALTASGTCASHRHHWQTPSGRRTASHFLTIEFDGALLHWRTCGGRPIAPDRLLPLLPAGNEPTAMHRRRRSNKNAQTARFSLLLLEDGELFLDVGLATL